MEIKTWILQTLGEKEWVTGAELCRATGVTRQSLHRHIQALRKTGSVVQEGFTRSARYRLTRPEDAEKKIFHRTIQLKNSQEDRWFAQADLFLSLQRTLRPNVYAILAYAFQEMLNNAMDHSTSTKAELRIECTPQRVSFSIRDWGIGVFASVARHFHLTDENDAMVEISKGKQTTMPSRHSGEGIFFTSKMGDQFGLYSHRTELIFDNTLRDVVAGEIRWVKGTEVRFLLDCHSPRSVEKIFAEYAPERHDYVFAKTHVHVRLIQTDYLSRSEARRLVSGLERFKEVVLDFSKVRSIGQGFADEVFRVYAHAHPQIKLIPLHMNPTVAAMIQHVEPFIP